MKSIVLDYLLEWDDVMLDDLGVAQAQVLHYKATTCKYHSDLTQAQAGSSRSICGLVVLNYVRLAYKLEAEGAAEMKLLRSLISQTLVNESMTISTDLKSLSQSTVDELLKVPIFHETLTATAISTAQLMPNVSALKDIFLNLLPATSSQIHAAVFTQSSEMLVCFRIPWLGSHAYALFDPHSRSAHPHGPAFTLSTQLDEIVASILGLLPHTTSAEFIGNESKYQFCVHILNVKPDIQNLDVEDLMAMSIVNCNGKSLDEPISFVFSPADHLALLRARAESVRKLHAKESSKFGDSLHQSEPSNSVVLAADHQRRSEFGWQLSLLLNQKPISVAPSVGDDEDKAPESPSQRDLCQHDTLDNNANEKNIPSPNLISKKSEFSWLTSFLQDSVQSGGDEHIDGHDENELNQDADKDLASKGLSHMRSAEFGWQLSLQKGPETNSGKQIAHPLKDEWDSNSSIHQHQPNANEWQVDLQHQLQEEEEIAATITHNTSRELAWLVALQKRLQEEEKEKSKSNALASSSLSPSEIDWQLAVQLQQEEAYRDESLNVISKTTRSSSELTTLDIPNQTSTESFECGICGEMHDNSEKIRLSDCRHDFCKDCLTTFTKTKIEEGRYPIFCPECILDRLNTSKSNVGQEILDKLDIGKENKERLSELQLVIHSVRLQCPRCKEIMNIDREQFGQQSVIVCPLPRCGQKWCKSCLKTLANSEDKHRCKNGNIDRLMERKGWKYCPGCRVPVQKESGCNHMTCGTPGCNVHFCYRCGVLVIDTTNGGDVGTAVTDHYANCVLFEKRLKCTIQ